MVKDHFAEKPFASPLFDPFLVPEQPILRHFGSFHGLQSVIMGSKRPKWSIPCGPGRTLKKILFLLFTHVNISADSFGFDEIHNGMYRGLLQFRSAYCGLHWVEKLRVAARRPAHVLVVSPISSGPRSQYVQAVAPSSNTVKNSALWYGRDG